MYPQFIIGLFLLLFMPSRVKGMLVKMGLKEDPNKPRTWFPEDPACHPDTCPEPGGVDWMNLNRRCCHDTYGLTFHCQTAEDGVKMSFCMNPVYCPAGTYADLLVIREKRWTDIEDFCHPCPAFEFQPDSTLSFMFLSPHCHYKPQLCVNLNASNWEPGSSTKDDICRCPHYDGYRPVETHGSDGQDCGRFESLSGCTCEYKPCPKKLKMTEKTYVCLDPDLVTALDGLERFVFESKHEEIEHLTVKYDICIGENCLQLWPCWVYNLLEHVRCYHMLFGLLLPLVITFVLAFGASRVWTWITNSPKQAIFICIVIPSPKICELVFNELKNTKPLLERLYGPLILDHDPQFLYISVIVQPDFAKKKFTLTQFVKDLISSVILEKHLKGTKNNVKVLIKQGKTSDIRKKWFQEPALKKKFTDSELPHNAGEIVLRCPSGSETETAIFGELKTAKRALSGFFKDYGLEFKEVARGSIVIRFKIPHGTDAFNSLAHEEEIKKMVADLMKQDAFKLDKQETLQLEFNCKTPISQMTAIQTEQLVIQIGNNNHVHIGNTVPLTPIEGTQEDEDEDEQHFDEGSLETSGENVYGQDFGYGATFQSFNIVNISPTRRRAIQAAPEPEANDPKSRVIEVMFRCKEQTTNLLYDEWRNIVPLLHGMHPNSKLCREPGKVWWELREKKGCSCNVSVFIGDLFKTERLMEIKKNHKIEIDVPVNRYNAGAVVKSWRVWEHSVVLRKLYEIGPMKALINNMAVINLFALLLFGLLNSGMLDPLGYGYRMFTILYFINCAGSLLYSCHKIGQMVRFSLYYCPQIFEDVLWVSFLTYNLYSIIHE